MRRLALIGVLIYTSLWLILKPIPHSAEHDLYIVFPRAIFNEQLGQYEAYNIGILHVDSGMQRTIKVGELNGEKILVSPLGEIIFQNSQGIYRIDSRSGKPEKLDIPKSMYEFYLWSSNGKYLLKRDIDDQFSLYDWHSMKFIMSFENISSTAWSPDSHYLAYTLDEQSGKSTIIYLMDMQNLNTTQLLELGTPIRLGDWSPNQQMLLLYTLNQTYSYTLKDNQISYLSKRQLRWIDNSSVTYGIFSSGSRSYFIQEIDEVFPKKPAQKIQITGRDVRYSPNNKYILAQQPHPSNDRATILCYEYIPSHTITCLPDFLDPYAISNWLLN